MGLSRDEHLHELQTGLLVAIQRQCEAEVAYSRATRELSAANQNTYVAKKVLADFLKNG